MFKNVRKSVMVNFIIFVASLITLTAVAGAYINYFQVEQYDGEITDKIAADNNAIIGTLNKAYKGVGTSNNVFKPTSIRFEKDYTFSDMNGREKKIQNAVIINNAVSYSSTRQFLTSGGYFLLLNKKGEEIMAQINTSIEEASKDHCKLVLSLGIDEEPYYLLVGGVKIGTSAAERRVFKIKKD